LIRQKIIVAIDGLFRPVSKTNQKTFLLYLPDGELHEIGLLFYSYLIQKRGHRVIYLGQMVPFEDMMAVAKAQNPDVFVSLFVSNLLNENIEEHLRMISEAFPTSKLFVGGLQFKQNDINMPPQAIVISDIQVFKDNLDQLESL
jgi:hypothetical protein